MALIAPNDLRGQQPAVNSRNAHVQKRDHWIVAQRTAGYTPDQIAKALGLGRDVIYRVCREARLNRGLGTRPPGPLPSAPAPQLEERPRDGKQSYRAPNGDRINLPCLPGHEGELAPLPREETKPRFSYMVAVPDRPSGQSRPQAASIEGVIAAIRQAHSERGHA